MMIYLVILTYLLGALFLAFTASIAKAAGGPNEPAGAVKLLESSNDTFPPTGFTNNYPGCNGFAGVSDGPKSPSGAYIEQRNAGTNNPPPSGGCSINGAFSPVRNVYGAMWYKTSNPYSGVSAGGTKLAGYMQQQNGNFFGIAFHGQNEYIYTWYNGQYPGFTGNCHYGGQPWFYDPRAQIGQPECQYGATLYPNIAYIGSGVGNWTLVEWYFQLSTCGTCRDGILKVWVNGTPTQSLTDINYPDTPFVAWAMTHTWDGVNTYINPAITDQIITDHMYLSTVGGGGGGGGGDTTPPGQVQNFTVIQTN